MRYVPLLAVSLLCACPAGVLVLKDEKPEPFPTDETDTDTDTDVDSDTDTDTDVDSDTDSDVDVDTAPTGTTADTGTIEPSNPPDWLVDCNGTGDFLTIQGAMDAAVSGQRIGVMPCVYHERIEFSGKALDVYGMDGSASTTIDADGQGSVVRVVHGEPDGTRLAGFTLLGGDDPDGAAIYVKLATIELFNLVMTENEGGGILRADDSIVDGDGLVVQGNNLPSDGEAVWSSGGTLTLTRSIIDCDDGEEAIWHHNLMLLTETTASCDAGYGVHGYHSVELIRRSVLTGGIAGLYVYDEAGTVELPDNPSERLSLWNSIVTGGSIGVDTRYMDIDIVNCVLTGQDAALAVTDLNASSTVRSTAFVGSACGVSGQGPIDVGSSAFWDNTADACGVVVTPTLTTDPLFVSWPDDLHLQAGSPLINAGQTGTANNDVDGTRNDIGVYGGPMPLP